MITLEQPDWSGLIICAPCNYNLVKSRWPKRKIEVSFMSPNDFIHVIRAKKKGVFSVSVSDFSIWIPAVYPFFKKKFEGKKNESD